MDQLSRPQPAVEGVVAGGAPGKAHGGRRAPRPPPLPAAGAGPGASPPRTPWRETESLFLPRKLRGQSLSFVSDLSRSQRHFGGSCGVQLFFPSIHPPLFKAEKTGMELMCLRNPSGGWKKTTPPRQGRVSVSVGTKPKTVLKNAQKGEKGEGGGGGKGGRKKEIFQGSGKIKSKDLERKEVKAGTFLAQSRPSLPLVTQQTHKKPTSGCSALRELEPKEAAEMM